MSIKGHFKDAVVAAVTMSALMGTSALATTFETYAGYGDTARAELNAKIIHYAETVAVKQGNRPFLTCIQTKFTAGTPEMSDFIGRLESRAEDGVTDHSVERAGLGRISVACHEAKKQGESALNGQAGMGPVAIMR